MSYLPLYLHFDQFIKYHLEITSPNLHYIFPLRYDEIITAMRIKKL